MGERIRRPYRPSSGDEGAGFESKFCSKCIHEKFFHTQQHGDKQCDIYSRALLFGINDKEYPKEWTYDENDKPVCTEWKRWDWGYDDDSGSWNDPPEPDPIDPNQLCLPFELMEIMESAPIKEKHKEYETA